VHARAAQRRRDGNPEIVVAQQLLQQGRNDEALTHFQRVLIHHAHDAQALRGTCVALDRLGRANDAARVCRHALDQNPDDLGTRRTLANIYFNGGAYKWSAAEWRRVVAADPKDERARRSLRLAESRAHDG
jgi:Flp pilus assembly protein TadD